MQSTKCRGEQEIKPVCDEIVELIPAMRAFARTFYRGRNDADDLVQETLLKGLSKTHLFEPGTSLKSWLFTIIPAKWRSRAEPESCSDLAAETRHDHD